MQLPLIPQHDQREPKNNPKYGAANIVHGVSAIEGDVDESVVVLLCGLGTGSCPPGHHGWQRPMRRKLR